MSTTPTPVTRASAEPDPVAVAREALRRGDIHAGKAREHVVALIAECDRRADYIVGLENGLSDTTTALLASEYCECPSTRGSLERFEVEIGDDEPSGIDGWVDRQRFVDPLDYQLCMIAAGWELSAAGNWHRDGAVVGPSGFPGNGWDFSDGKNITAGGHYKTAMEAAAACMQARAEDHAPPREAVPAAVVEPCALPEGWRWITSADSSQLYRGDHYVALAEGRGWFVIDGRRTDCLTGLAAAQAALVAELRSRGVLPAVPQPDGGKPMSAFETSASRCAYKGGHPPNARCPACPPIEATQPDGGASGEAGGERAVVDWRSIGDEMGWIAALQNYDRQRFGGAK